MPYRRRRMNGGGRRRFFRRRRGGTRPTTEQGARVERCHFNFLIDQPIDDSGLVNSDAIMLVGGQSLLGALGGFGTQAAAVARAMQLPLRYYEVKGLVLDISCYMDPALTVSLPASEVIQVGWAVNTQRLDQSGAPTFLPSYWESQWPVNQTSGLAAAGLNEDRDYATRTHVLRAGTLASNVIVTSVGDTDLLVPGPWNRSWYSRLKVRRQISDEFGLFFQTWNIGAPNGPNNLNCVWRVVGSLWYKMRY